MVIKYKSVLEEFRRSPRCHLCLRATPGGCDPHHILTKGAGSGGRLDHPMNLLALCRECHTKVHMANATYKGRKMTATDLFSFVAEREGEPHYDLQNAVTLFRNMSPKLTETEVAARVGRMRPGTARLFGVLLEARRESMAKGVKV